MNKKPRLILIYLLLGLAAVLFLSFVFQNPTYKLTWDQFRYLLDSAQLAENQTNQEDEVNTEVLSKGQVLSLKIGPEEVTGKAFIPEGFKFPDHPKAPEDPNAKKKPQNSMRPGAGNIFRAQLPTGPKSFHFEATIPPGTREGVDEITSLAQDQGIKVEGERGSAFGIFLILIPIFILLLLWFWIIRQSNAGRAALSFGKSKARMYAEKVKTVSFEDVAGCEEAKVELAEIVDFLKNPKKYQTLGGRMPRGVLLVGPPGTGKTLIARAVAGEAKRPFFSLSGSEFVEMFVGVGAARVRDLFQQAKDNSPCIIFIDELDAVGRHRGAGLGGGHDEREQTLNQLLVEMDGFDVNSGVIILAATNRPDVLDPALLRPGRFDRQVVLDAPDLRGRKAILEVHSKDKPIEENIDLGNIAGATPGFSGADLANVINEAALLAARRDKTQIGRDELEEATERVIAGPERRSRRLGDAERKRVAYHEAGHALVAALSKNADPVRKISIVPRGHAALGYTMQFPEDDRYLTMKSALEDRLKTLLAGRAAERLVFEEFSTGAADDLNRASDIARSMVCRFGMSEKIGPVALGKEQRQVFLGRDIGSEDRNYSEQTAQEIDSEVRRIIEEADVEAHDILTKYREALNLISEELLEKEVIHEEELDEILIRELEPKGVELPHVIAKRKAKAAAEAAKAAEQEKESDSENEEASSKSEEPDPPPNLKEGWATGTS